MEIVHFCSLTARGTPLTPRTPPHSLWQVPVARPGLRGLRLSSWSHPEPSFPRTAASPVRSDCFAPVGVQVIHEPATPVRLCRTASGACLIKYSCQPCCAGVCLAPHHRHHVARRSAMTSASVLVHDCRTCCTCFAKLTRAGPYHLLTGTVALFRMGKRLPVV